MTSNNLVAQTSPPQWMPSLSQLEASLAADKANAISSRPQLPRPLSQEERRCLAELAEYHRADAEALPDMETALTEIAMLIRAFPVAKLTQEQDIARVRAYAIAMDDIPTWAIAEACRRWLKGDVPEGSNLSFPPSAPQLRALAAEELAKAKAALLRAERLLNAKVEKPKKLSEDRRREAEAILGRYGYGTAQAGE